MHFDEGKADEATVSYEGALGLDMIVGGSLGFFTAQFQELAAGIHMEEHHIRIYLSEIRKAKPLMENIVLHGITPGTDVLKIEFGLKTDGK